MFNNSDILFFLSNFINRKNKISTLNNISQVHIIDSSSNKIEKKTTSVICRGAEFTNLMHSHFLTILSLSRLRIISDDLELAQLTKNLQISDGFYFVKTGLIMFSNTRNDNHYSVFY